MSVAVLDYGVGNVRSLMNALARLNCPATLTSNHDAILASRKLIIPGVGAFAHCMQRLQALGLDRVIRRAVDSNRQILGICVGMQMLFDESEEHGRHPGLGLIPGRVQRLPVATGRDIRLPHIGWTRVAYSGETNAPCWLGKAPDDAQYYFVHSYACYPEGDEYTLAQARYAGETFTAAVRSGSVFGVQFHPERSGNAGLALLDRFVRA